jgi:hypothetical protein
VSGFWRRQSEYIGFDAMGDDMRIRGYIVALTAGLIAMLTTFVPAWASDCGEAWGDLSKCYSICPNGGPITIKGIITLNVPPGGCSYCDTAQTIVGKYCPLSWGQKALQKKKLNAGEVTWLRAHLKGISPGSGNRTLRTSNTLNVYHGRNVTNKGSTNLDKFGLGPVGQHTVLPSSKRASSKTNSSRLQTLSPVGGSDATSGRMMLNQQNMIATPKIQIK